MDPIHMEGIEQSPLWEKTEATKLSEFISEENISSGDSISSSDRSTITSEHSRDSDNDSSARSPPLSPPHKRPRQLRRLNDFNTAEELKLLPSIANEVMELKDYAEWFMSLGPEIDKDGSEILRPIYYGAWWSDLGTEAQAKVAFTPLDFIEWAVPRFNKPTVSMDWDRVSERCGQHALEYFKEISKGGDYEYVRKGEILRGSVSYHLNFFARLKVSESTQEPRPEKLFFAEVGLDNKVLECCILDTEEIDDFGEVIHPPNIDCPLCNGSFYSCPIGENWECENDSCCKSY